MSYDIKNQFDKISKNIEFPEHAEEEKSPLKQSHKSAYENWYQGNTDPEISKAMQILSLKCPTGRALIDFIILHMDNRNALIASYKVFAEALNVSTSSITRAVKYLSDNNYIKIAKSGSANVYYLNSQIAWKSWGNNKKYSEFDAKVIIAQSEQPEAIVFNKKIAIAEIK